MANIELIRELEKFPIVTKATIKKVLGCDDNYAYTVLTRLNKKGILKQVKKGKYTSIDNIYVIATNIFTPSYLCLWTASSYKGYTEQILNEVQVATTRKRKSLNFEKYRILPIKFKKSIFFGYKKIRLRENFELFISEDEKLLIDALLFQDKMGNPEEIIKVVKSAKIEKEKIVKYLKKIGNKSLMKRTGFLLEKFKGMDIFERLKIEDRNYPNLFLNQDSKKIDKKWRLRHDL